jgi:hypothetical protein
MTDEFFITIEYKNQEHHFPAKLLLQGFTHKFQVTVFGTDVFFEPDEERQYRVVMMPGQQEKELMKIDKAILAAIQQKITAILA